MYCKELNKALFIYVLEIWQGVGTDYETNKIFIGFRIPVIICIKFCYLKY